MGTDLLSKKIVDRFCLLEQYIPKVNSGLFTPSHVPILWEILETQDLAYEMMKFAGLEGYTPQIRFKELSEGVAGNVTLNNSKSKIVYINISEAEKEVFPYRIISILAHEICHKVLYVNNFPFLEGIENEIYTDLCTFYLGFGFYTTEGYEHYITEENSYGHERILGRNIVGYLSEKTVARAYIISQLCMNLPYDNCTRRREVVEKIEKVDDISALIKYREKVSIENFEYLDFYRIVCPKCGCISSSRNTKNYGKKFVCKHCGEEFIFTWHIYDKDNPIYKSKYVPTTKINFNKDTSGLLNRIKQWVNRILKR